MDEEKSIRAIRCSDHLANERTFLAWIRTSIGIMAFGFVIEKFSLFIKQISYLFGKPITSSFPHIAAPPGGYSSIFGILVVALGALIGLLAFIRYSNVRRQIDEESYQASIVLDVMLTLSVLSVGIFLVLYLIHTL